MPGDRTDTDLVLAVRSGDRDAFATLFERWFDRVYDVAWNIVRNPETAADIAQDTFIAAWERIERLENPDAFGGWLLRISRNRALDRLERDGRSRPQEHDVVTGLHDRGARDLTGSNRTLQPEEISATNDRDGLVRAAAVALGERDASVLDLHLRHGLTPAEIADELGITANNAHQLLFRMRKKLGDAIGAFVLFGRGTPRCADLTRLLPADAEFDAATFALVERHRRSCAECTDRRALLVSPEQLFSAAPIMVAPLLLRSRVLGHLRDAGVPTPTDTTGSATAEPATEPAATEPAATEPATPATAAPDSGTVGDDVAPLEWSAPHDAAVPEPVVERSWRRPAAAILAAAAVVIVLLVVAVGTGNESTGDPQTALGAPPTTSLAETSTTPPGTDATEPRIGAPAPTIADELTVATEAPADVAPTTAAPLAPTPSEPPTPASPGRVAPAPPTPTPTPPPPTPPPTSAPTVPSPDPTPTTAPATTAPPTTVPPTTAPPTTAPPPPDIVRLFTPTAAPPGPICASGSPYRFNWTTTGVVSSATLGIGTTNRNVGAQGPHDACGSSGQVVTLTVTGPGGTDSASTAIP